tara:strand:+ start:779 stop:1117 length:339 start_codon:yes stop_codon:yes gene_type:complete
MDKFNKIVEHIIGHQKRTLDEDASPKALKMLKKLHSMLEKEKGITKITGIHTDRKYNDSSFYIFVNDIESEFNADINGEDNLVYYIGDDETPGTIDKLDTKSYKDLKDELGL